MLLCLGMYHDVTISFTVNYYHRSLLQNIIPVLLSILAVNVQCQLEKFIYLSDYTNR